ncbi:DUF3558 family protein [Saccharopolyspora sp. NPDC002686]|uniref:DUF3558 family protein n=1 Tax=Saccharopolyspora sp. NPDC002686 TaxID=3154541 RepID=UPI003322C133
MNVLSRAVFAACASAVALTVAGCGGPTQGGDPASEAQSQKGLAVVDPCELLAPEQLKSFGFNGPGEPTSIVPSQPGCAFKGEPFSITVFKNEEETVESLGRQEGTWAKFDRLEVDGRPAASGISSGSTRARICSAMFNAGGGVIILTVQEFRDQGLDECAEGLKVAEAVAPKLPK